MVTFNNHVSLEEYREANRLATRNRSRALYILVYRGWLVGLVILASIFVPWFASHGAMRPWSRNESVIAVTILISLFVLLPVSNRLEMDRRYAKVEAVEAEATEAGYSCRLPDGSSSFTPWSRFCSFIDGSGVFLLRLRDSICSVIVSKRSLTPEQQDELRALLDTHIQPK